MVNRVTGDRRGKTGGMANQAVREALEQLIRSSGDGYAAVSRLLGRNPAYIQQFIKRGVPRRLSETDRRLIASHFGVSESILGAPDGLPRSDTTQPPLSGSPSSRNPHPQPYRLQPDTGSFGNHAAIPYLPSRSAPSQTLAVDSQFLQRLSGGRVPSLSAHSIDSDCMAPTLIAGDQVLIDTSDKRAPRDGIYVIESDGALIVKRLAVHPVTRRIAVLSDNAAYPSFPDCDPDGVRIIGRVFWVGRRLP